MNEPEVEDQDVKPFNITKFGLVIKNDKKYLYSMKHLDYKPYEFTDDLEKYIKGFDVDNPEEKQKYKNLLYETNNNKLPIPISKYIRKLFYVDDHPLTREVPQ